MKLNIEKCHLLISVNINEYIRKKLDQGIVCESNNVELLGVTRDNNLRFDKHVSNICLKVNRKVSVSKYLSLFLLKRTYSV